MYVALEGIDTCGKSTQIELLASHLNANSSQVIFTKEPGGTLLGKKIRDLILFSHLQIDSRAEFMLFLADRAQHYTEVLATHKDKLIIADRSVISSIAYAKHIDMPQAIAFNRFVLRDTMPDLVIILELSREDLQKRISIKHNDNIERRGIDYMLEIQNRIYEATKALQIPLLSLGANQTKEAICQQILREIKNEMSMCGLDSTFINV